MTGPFLTDTVTRLRMTTTTDRYGNTVPASWEPLEITGCAVLPPNGQTAPSVETVDNADMVTVVRVLFAPAGTDIVATDRVQHAGTTYEVFGLPSPFPRALAHVEANLRLVTG